MSVIPVAFTANKMVFSQNTTLLFDKLPTYFGCCFVVVIRPIPRIKKKENIQF